MRKYIEHLQNYLKKRFNFEISDWEIIAVIVLILIILSSSLFIYLREKGSSSVKETATAEKQSPQPEKNNPANTNKIKVYVSGAVENPGVYEIAQDKRVNDAITLAGGFSTEADTNSINLAAKISDGDKIFVPAKNETNSSVNQSKEESKVDINNALAEELDEKIPGIGPILAKRIIDYRAEHGRFTDISQLQEVEGIGPKKFEKIKKYVTL